MEGKGTYTLIMQLKEGRKLRVGALGEIYFEEGFYAYTGSALGSGGFSRIKRHLDVAAGKNSTRKWHIDYLLPHSDVLQTVTSVRPECSVAAGIDAVLPRIAGFGCSDCRCQSHLHYSRTLDSMVNAVRKAHRV
ncbi:GIY-YIG nuclease family protein [Methanocella arvoryzae]|uniref:GIY-YIG domain-containing protein n=1 Tax=Methanocella arvoryzae (strain DSM 22066 / NBRC 105507 / MRE50) TaxID=351160 RepID=Q0W2V8_METAR|nr:GIY-YIG nuclease family protein [Methanocella arvoryzae]CAJ37285.1 hypothetical protein RCIX2161 [Methanocella arvoryzae MRE50]